MAVENHYHTDTPAADTSSMMTIVAIVAILLLIGLGMLAFRSGMPGAATGTSGAGTTNAGELNVDLNPANALPGAMTTAPAQ